MRTQDLTGRIFGRWQVVKFSHYVGNDTRHRRYYWLCRCECGTVRAVDRNGLVQGASVSCGCYHRESVGIASTRHGMANTPEYHAWQHMKARCDNPSDAGFKDYGERGITVCSRWYDFNEFLADMGPRPSLKHSLERKNNELGYSPENCTWAKAAEQQNNRRNNNRLRFNGRVQTMAQWAEETGIALTNIWNRKADGWSTHDALTVPVSQSKAGWDTRRARK